LKEKKLMTSLHLKATMMKISDPVLFGHCVQVYYKVKPGFIIVLVLFRCKSPKTSLCDPLILLYRTKYMSSILPNYGIGLSNEDHAVFVFAFVFAPNLPLAITGRASISECKIKRKQNEVNS
jgi:hypothetical protein